MKKVYSNLFLIVFYLEIMLICLKKVHIFHRHFYRPQTKFRETIFFSQACIKNSVHGGGDCLPQCMLGYALPGRHYPGRNPPGRHPPPDSHCSGRYVSYWNAWLC